MRILTEEERKKLIEIREEHKKEEELVVLFFLSLKEGIIKFCDEYFVHKKSIDDISSLIQEIKKVLDLCIERFGELLGTYNKAREIHWVFKKTYSNAKKGQKLLKKLENLRNELEKGEYKKFPKFERTLIIHSFF